MNTDFSEQATTGGIPKKYRVAVFDLDGTLLDTLDDLTASVAYALLSCSFPARTRDEVRSFVGNGIKKLIERAVPSYADERQIEAVYETFKIHYASHCADNTLPYPGIVDLLDILHKNDVKVAIVSNKADFAVQSLEARYFGDLVDLAVGERADVRRKPCADGINEVLKTLCASKDETLYVGDSDVDIQTAANAGVDCASVTWGFRNEDFLRANGAQIIVRTADDLMQYFV